MVWFLAAAVSFAVALVLSLADAAVDFDFVVLGLLLLALGHALPALGRRV